MAVIEDCHINDSPGPKYKLDDTVGGADVTFGLKVEVPPPPYPAPNAYTPIPPAHNLSYTMAPKVEIRSLDTRPGITMSIRSVSMSVENAIPSFV